MKVQLDQVGKRYKYEWIFRGIDATFEKGQSYAIQGPNGSGKSTLLKVLSGHLTPSKGTISFEQDGVPLEINQVYKELTFAAPYVALIEDFTLEEAINFHQRFKQLLPGLSTKGLIDLLGFQKSTNKAVKYFSSGMKQRLKLALAICSKSNFLLLDEPTTNLDEQGVGWYRSLIEQYTANRLLVIASNVAVDFDFCKHQLQITDYKKKTNR
ncbi:MAG: ABC transporter ATP-binding protein [Saprospiraceae bacterium]